MCPGRRHLQDGRAPRKEVAYRKVPGAGVRDSATGASARGKKRTTRLLPGAPRAQGRRTASASGDEDHERRRPSPIRTGLAKRREQPALRLFQPGAVGASRGTSFDSVTGEILDLLYHHVKQRRRPHVGRQESWCGWPLGDRFLRGCARPVVSSHPAFPRCNAGKWPSLKFPFETLVEAC